MLLLYRACNMHDLRLQQYPVQMSDCGGQRKQF